MHIFFDEDTDKKLLEAKSEEEVRAIIAGTPEAGKLADKIDLVMAEISRIKDTTDEEIDGEELDNVAAGSKVKVINLSESVGCVATFYLEDWMNGFGASAFCISSDQCYASNEYEYHFTKFANCRKGGKHNWSWHPGGAIGGGGHYICEKCDVRILAGVDYYRFDR